MLSLFDDNVACFPVAIDQSDRRVLPPKAGSAQGLVVGGPHHPPHPTFKPSSSAHGIGVVWDFTETPNNMIDEPVGFV